MNSLMRAYIVTSVLVPKAYTLTYLNLMRYMCMYKYSNYVYRNSLFLTHDCYLGYYAMD